MDWRRGTDSKAENNEIELMIEKARQYASLKQETTNNMEPAMTREIMEMGET